MFMWGFPALGCTLLVSALLLRRWPLAALAVMLGGSVASTAQQPAAGAVAGARVRLRSGPGDQLHGGDAHPQSLGDGVAMVAGVSRRSRS